MTLSCNEVSSVCPLVFVDGSQRLFSSRASPIMGNSEQRHSQITGLACSEGFSPLPFLRHTNCNSLLPAPR